MAVPLGDLSFPLSMAGFDPSSMGMGFEGRSVKMAEGVEEIESDDQDEDALSGGRNGRNGRQQGNDRNHDQQSSGSSESERDEGSSDGGIVEVQDGDDDGE